MAKLDTHAWASEGECAVVLRFALIVARRNPVITFCNYCKNHRNSTSKTANNHWNINTITASAIEQCGQLHSCSCAISSTLHEGFESFLIFSPTGSIPLVLKMPQPVGRHVNVTAGVLIGLNSTSLTEKGLQTLRNLRAKLGKHACSVAPCPNMHVQSHRVRCCNELGHLRCGQGMRQTSCGNKPSRLSAKQLCSGCQTQTSARNQKKSEGWKDAKTRNESKWRGNYGPMLL